MASRAPDYIGRQQRGYWIGIAGYLVLLLSCALYYDRMYVFLPVALIVGFSGLAFGYFLSRTDPRNCAYCNHIHRKEETCGARKAYRRPCDCDHYWPKDAGVEQKSNPFLDRAKTDGSEI